MQTIAINDPGHLSVCYSVRYVAALCKHDWTDRGFACGGDSQDTKEHCISYESRFSHRFNAEYYSGHWLTLMPVGGRMVYCCGRSSRWVVTRTLPCHCATCSRTCRTDVVWTDRTLLDKKCTLPVSSLHVSAWRHAAVVNSAGLINEVNQHRS